MKQGDRQRLRSAHRIAEENIASDQQALITFPLHIVHYTSLTVSGRENAPNGQKRRKSTLYGGIAKSEHFASLQQHVGIGDGRYSHAQAEVADLLIYALPRITFALTAVPEMEIRLSQIRLPLPRQSRVRNTASTRSTPLSFRYWTIRFVAPGASDCYGGCERKPKTMADLRTVSTRTYAFVLKGLFVRKRNRHHLSTNPCTRN